MPRTPINYNNTIIYKIVCNDINIKDIYVGATTDTIRRKQNHKHTCNNENSKEYNRKIYQTIRANNGFDNWTMLEVEKYPCSNKAESDIRERYWLETLNANMNSQIPNRSIQEYYVEHKEQITQYNKEYQVINKEKVSQYKKVYYEEHKDEIKKRNNEKCNCCCGGKYTVANKIYHTKSQKHLLYVISTLSNDPNVLDI
jgi:hypothetical protein